MIKVSFFQEADSDLDLVGNKITDLIKKLENVVSSAVSKARGKLSGAQHNVDDTAASVKRGHLALKEQQEEMDVLTYGDLPEILSENIIECVDALAEKATNAISDGYNRVSFVNTFKMFNVQHFFLY